MARRAPLTKGWRRYAVALTAAAVPFTVAACGEDEPVEDTEVVDDEDPQQDDQEPAE